MAPITSTVRGIRLEVELKGVEAEGAILIYQMKSLDLQNRDIELIEKALPATTTKVTELAQIITK